MKKTLAAIAALVAVTAGATAHAATYTTRPDTFDGSSGNFGHSAITRSFADAYDFTNVVAGTYDITLSTASSGLSFTTMTFDNMDLVHLMNIGKTSYYGLTDVSVDAGTQVIDVAGAYNGAAKTTGSYDGTVSFSAVSAAPEPSSWALLMLGIGGIGMAFRQARRRQSPLEGAYSAA